MSTATPLPRDLSDYKGQATLYHLSEPWEGHRYVVASTVDLGTVEYTEYQLRFAEMHVITEEELRRHKGIETVVFPADVDGRPNASALATTRSDSHEEALAQGGYTIVKEESSV